jgi:hypothetical protein
MSIEGLLLVRWGDYSDIHELGGHPALVPENRWRAAIKPTVLPEDLAEERLTRPGDIPQPRSERDERGFSLRTRPYDPNGAEASIIERDTECVPYLHPPLLMAVH